MELYEMNLMENNKNKVNLKKANNKSANKKTWLSLTDKELGLLKSNSACMYGGKNSPTGD